MSTQAIHPNLSHLRAGSCGDDLPRESGSATTCSGISTFKAACAADTGSQENVLVFGTVSRVIRRMSVFQSKVAHDFAVCQVYLPQFVLRVVGGVPVITERRVKDSITVGTLICQADVFRRRTKGVGVNHIQMPGRRLGSVFVQFISGASDPQFLAVGDEIHIQWSAAGGDSSKILSGVKRKHVDAMKGGMNGVTPHVFASIRCNVEVKAGFSTAQGMVLFRLLMIVNVAGGRNG